MLIFTLTVYFFYHVKQNRFQLILKSLVATILLVITLWSISPEFQQRVDRSLALFQGSKESIDFALADRLSIWESSINMIIAHPINGIGAHAFRKAYPEFAEKDDIWQQKGDVGMHAHHWILEVLSETGIIGLSLILFAMLRLFNFLKPYLQSPYTWAFAVSLLSAFLPIISTYSIFASFWSICLWLIGSALILVSVKDD
jgi:O-antigen ligase